MERDDVGFGQELVQRAVAGPAVRRSPGVQNPQLEALGAPGHGLADSPEADDAERRACDFVAFQRLVGPAAPPPARADDAVAGGDTPADGEDQAQREIGGCPSGDTGSVRDCDPSLSAGGYVDEVVAGAVVRDDLEVREPCECLRLDGLSDDSERFDVDAWRLKIPVLDVRELVPRRPWKPS